MDDSLTRAIDRVAEKNRRLYPVMTPLWKRPNDPITEMELAEIRDAIMDVYTEVGFLKAVLDRRNQKFPYRLFYRK